MPKQAFIIEDDEAAAKLLGMICERLGLETTHFANGKDGYERSRVKEPDLIVLDLLLPGMDGLRICRELKAENLRSRIVIVTAVYKDPKIARELHEKYGAEIVYKPFRAEEVERAICRALGLQPPAAAPRKPETHSAAVQAVVAEREGRLEESPFVTLVAEIVRARGTAIVDLARDQARRRVVFERGMVRFAQSNLKGENVGGMQVAEGRLSDEAFARAVAVAKSEKLSLGQALLRSGALSAEEVRAATRRQVEAVFLGALDWREGHFRISTGSPGELPQERRDPVALVLAGYRAKVSPEQAQERLAQASAALLARAEDFDRCLFTMRSVFAGESLTPLINGRSSVEEVLGKAQAQDLPLLVAAIDLGLVELRNETGGRETLPFAPEKTGGPGGDGTQAVGTEPAAASPDALRAQRALEAEWERVANSPDHFAVLGVERTARPEQIQAAYRALARRFHRDAFPQALPGPAAAKLEAIVACLSEAHAILTDPGRRAEYEALLEKRADGRPAEAGVIFKAESVVNRAAVLLDQGRASEAEAALREALKSDPGVAQYHCALGRVVLKRSGARRAAEARAAFEKALELDPGLVEAALYRAVAIGWEGDAEQANKLMREVLARHPGYAEAQREHRALMERSKKGEGKGLLGRFLKRNASP